MTAVPRVQYFLGANAPSGFYSLYSELLPPAQARAIYILKGGPGCGKSTLMGKVARRMEAAGHRAEYILCSGDPDSLDAVVLPELGAALVDGTAPHVVEPRLPGAVERYVNMGDCYDPAALYPIRESLSGAMAGYKDCYRRAYHCLEAAAALTEDVRSVLLTEELETKLARRARGILSRELKGEKGAPAGQVRQRFLGAVTHRGALTLFETADAQCPRVYELADRYGLAHELLLPLLHGGLENGFDAVACPDPMAPHRLAHLLFPGAGLAFVTSTPTLPYPGRPYRRIRLDAAADGEILGRNRPRMRFARKISAALMDEGVELLARAKEMHDDLEELYRPHVDFAAADALAQAVGDEILSFA